MTKKGFTLIELLIVVTIIGILAVALVPRIVGGSASARDSRRQTNVQSIITGLEYYLSENGDFDDINGGSVLGNDLCSVDGDLDDLVTFIGAIPADPQATNENEAFAHAGCDGGYVVTLLDDASANLTKYAVAAKMEVASATDDLTFTTLTVEANRTTYAALTGGLSDAGADYYVAY